MKCAIVLNCLCDSTFFMYLTAIVLKFTCHLGRFKEIEDYNVKFGVESALKVSDHILDGIEGLEMFPNLSLLTQDKWLNEQGYRMLICVIILTDTQIEYTKLF